MTTDKVRIAELNALLDKKEAENDALADALSAVLALAERFSAEPALASLLASEAVKKARALIDARLP